MSSTTADMGEDLRIGESDAEAWLWWSQVPTLPGERLGVIGRFSATNEAGARAVLERAVRELARRGCTRAVGPMNGNTWRSYRLVTDPGEEPPFLLEPTNPPAWPLWWRAAGFAPLADYYSTTTDSLTERDPRVTRVAERLSAGGIALRSLRPEAFGDELDRIYAVSVVSFQENFLYTPLPREAFVAQYLALHALVKPELVLLAECAGEPVGYVFGVPDYARAQRGATVDTVIVKTLAVLPGRRFAGLGAWLLDELHQRAQALGYVRAIHALMHEHNGSRNLSAHQARTIRRYTLFSRALEVGRP